MPNRFHLAPFPVILLFAANWMVNAYGDLYTNYTISFAQTSGSDDVPNGTIAYDETNPAISALVEWDGYAFAFPDLTAAGYGFLPGSSRPASCLGGVQAQIVLQFLEGCAGVAPDWEVLVPSIGAGITFFVTATDSTGGVNLYSTSDFLPLTTLPPPTEDLGTFSTIVAPEPVPEPSALLLLCTELLGLLALTVSVGRAAGRAHVAFPAVVCFALIACPLSSADVDLTYTYSGNAFTSFSGTDECQPQCHLSGWFTIADVPLQPYSGFSSPTAVIFAHQYDLTFSFTDGLNTITQTDASTVAFQLPIDSSGNWDISAGWCIDIIMGGLNMMSTFNAPGCASTSDQTYLFGAAPSGSGQELVGSANVFGGPGTWTETTTSSGPMATPEPSALLLLCTYCTVLLGVSWLGKQVCSKAMPLRKH